MTMLRRQFLFGSALAAIIRPSHAWRRGALPPSAYAKAVHFEPTAGLEQDFGPANFSTATIAFFFRVSSADMAAAQADWLAQDSTPLVNMNMAGIIPLVTFGPAGIYTSYTTTTPGGVLTYTPSFSCATPPCLIGVMCDGDAVKNSLIIRLQYVLGGSTVPPTFVGTPTPIPVAAPDYFMMGGIMQGGITGGSDSGVQLIEVTPDVWHSVIVSFDITNPAAGLCYVAFDNVNYNGDHLGPYSTGGNGVQTCFNALASAGLPDQSPTIATFLDTVNFQIGIPSDVRNDSYAVDMEEFQMFTGTGALDLSVQANRRLFVNADLTSADFTLAATHFGRLPNIRFCESAQNWIAGLNSGQDGRFTSLGGITVQFDAP